MLCFDGHLGVTDGSVRCDADRFGMKRLGSTRLAEFCNMRRSDACLFFDTVSTFAPPLPKSYSVASWLTKHTIQVTNRPRNRSRSCRLCLSRVAQSSASFDVGIASRSCTNFPSGVFYVHASRAVYVTPELSNRIGLGIDFGVFGGLFKVIFNFQTRRRLLGADDRVPQDLS